MSISTYRKKPLTVQAWQIPFEVIMKDHDELIAFLGDGWGMLWDGRFQSFMGEDAWRVYIKTLEGMTYGKSGDYIVRGIAGEFYPCAKHIFENSYDKVEEFDV